MKFNSQIATDKNQSERLLALGLKKETADMIIPPYNEHSPWAIGKNNCLNKNWLPAWSLGRLMEMLPNPIPISEYLPTFKHYAYLDLSKESVGYYWEDYDGADRALIGFSGKGFFSAVVDATEWLIKNEYFNKEYLI